jgi:hypothetical protein
MSGCSGHGAAPSGQPQAIGRVAPDELTHRAYQFDSRATPAGTSQPLRLPPDLETPRLLDHRRPHVSGAYLGAHTPTGLHESRGDSQSLIQRLEV